VSAKTALMIFVLLMLFLLIVPVLVFASDPECRGHSCNGGVGDITTEVAGSSISTSSKGFGVGGGDMDIADCLATHSVLFGLWQGTHVNPLCEANRLNAMGRFEAAARMKCSTHKFRKVYGTGQDCIDAVIMEAKVVVIAEADRDSAQEEEDEQEWMLEQQQLIIDLQEKYDNLEREQRQVEVAQQAQQAQQPIEYEPFLNASKRSKLEAIRGEN